MADPGVIVYPPPRPDRGSAGGGVAGAVAVAAQPRSRSFWFELRTNAASRTTISTPQLRGPVVVQGIQWGAGGGSPPDAGGWYIDIGQAPAPVAEVNVAVNGTRNWQSLFEDMVPRTANVAAGLTGFPSHSGWGAVGDNWWPINALVTGADFYIVLSILNVTAGVRISHGTLYVVEALSPQAAENFR